MNKAVPPDTPRALQAQPFAWPPAVGCKGNEENKKNKANPKSPPGPPPEPPAFASPWGQSTCLSVSFTYGILGELHTENA